MFRPKATERRPFHPEALRAALVALIALVAMAIASPAFPAEGQSTGLPLPRFASTRAAPVNVRVGPGFKYDIAWVYVKPAVPVEIIEEFDVWRKIRDVDGAVGWVHESLLSGKRVALVAPWQEAAKVALRARADAAASVRAWLGARFPVAIDRCDGTWCAVTATDRTRPDRPASYSGFVAQDELWGVYQGEKVD